MGAPATAGNPSRGDWDGDGDDTAGGLHNSNTADFHLRNTNDTGVADIVYRFGPGESAWAILGGDWDNNAVDTPGFYESATAQFRLRNANTTGPADVTFNYGTPNDGSIAVAGDWNFDNVDTIGLYYQSSAQFHLRNMNSAGPADLIVNYGLGNNNWIPITGDWDGDGDDTVGLYDPATGNFHLRNSNTSGEADITPFVFGTPGSGFTPLAGDWNGDGKDTVGLYDAATGTFYLRNATTAGVADWTFVFGPAGTGYKPLALARSLDGPTTTFEYEATGRQRLKKITLPDRDGSGPQSPLVINYDVYDNADNVTQLSYQLDATTSYVYVYTYDKLDRVTMVTLPDPDGLGSLLAPVTSYAYNSLTQLWKITESDPDGTGGPLPQPVTEYNYDNTSQLTGASGARSEAYSYDVNGNRTMAGYQTDQNNRLTSDGTFTYEYDNEGNRTRRTRISSAQANDYITEYEWDHRGRLMRVVSKNNQGTVTKEAKYTYDVFDRLIGRWLDPDGATGSAALVQSWTVYDGYNPYADFSASGSLTNRYLYGPAVDFLMARIDAAGDEDWYLTDVLGSVRQIVDTNGTILDRIDYDSYGKVVSETNPAEGDRFKYTSREWESAVDLYFYRARWYDAAVGRFASEDPIGFAAGDENLSRYVGNAPTNLTDPLGLQQQKKPWRSGDLERMYGELGMGRSPTTEADRQALKGLAAAKGAVVLIDEVALIAAEEAVLSTIPLDSRVGRNVCRRPFEPELREHRGRPRSSYHP
ncbi:MAG: hypothetical protein HY000_17015 [Planctomycetes bacterium]|nr:hypothetical protein [Planctomycetota bacterium]